MSEKCPHEVPKDQFCMRCDNGGLNPRPGVAIIAERSKIRGAFTEQARVSQNLKHSMRDAEGWDRLLPAQKEALDNMANKMARILTGDPHEFDSWADISGYAELIIKNGNYTERQGK